MHGKLCTRGKARFLSRILCCHATRRPHKISRPELPVARQAEAAQCAGRAGVGGEGDVPAYEQNSAEGRRRRKLGGLAVRGTRMPREREPTAITATPSMSHSRETGPSSSVCCSDNRLRPPFAICRALNCSNDRYKMLVPLYWSLVFIVLCTTNVLIHSCSSEGAEISSPDNEESW